MYKSVEIDKILYVVTDDTGDILVLRKKNGAFLRQPLGGVSAPPAPDLHIGEELAYAERTTDDTTTNITATNVALNANKIPGLVANVVGIGRPVEIEFKTQVYHTVANTGVSAILLVNGEGLVAPATWETASSPSTSGSIGQRPLFIKRRLVLLEGVNYTFEVAKQLAAAGTGTYEGDVFRPMYLSVVQR